jgi:hypothetical protein
MIYRTKQLYFYGFMVLATIENSCGSRTEYSIPVHTIPPYSGTIFLDPDIITPDDPTSFETLTAIGQGQRVMYDRRVSNWITVEAYLFLVTFDDGLSVEVQVNPEFGNSEVSQAEAEKYATVIGRLPTSLRKDVETVWIHKGTQPFGGGNKNLLIHVGQADLYVKDGILEETFVHEASHTSLDAIHSASADWLEAQEKDPTFISTYARDNPTREDMAETFLVYLATRHRKDRISSAMEKTVLSAIPNRIQYLDGQSWDLYPVQ